METSLHAGIIPPGALGRLPEYLVSLLPGAAFVTFGCRCCLYDGGRDIRTAFHHDDKSAMQLDSTEPSVNMRPCVSSPSLAFSAAVTYVTQGRRPALSPQIRSSTLTATESV